MARLAADPDRKLCPPPKRLRVSGLARPRFQAVRHRQQFLERQAFPATATEYDFKVPIDCSSTVDPSIGSTCSANTTANALVPGLIQEQRQTVVQAFRVRIDDSGANGVRGDSDDRIFMTQGVFVP